MAAGAENVASLVPPHPRGRHPGVRGHHAAHLVAERRGIALAEAEKEVDEINKQREQYVRTTFKRSWKAHENYHLCVNTEWLGVEGAAQLIVDTARHQGIAPR